MNSLLGKIYQEICPSFYIYFPKNIKLIIHY